MRTIVEYRRARATRRRVPRHISTGPGSDPVGSSTSRITSAAMASSAATTTDVAASRNASPPLIVAGSSGARPARIGAVVSSASTAASRVRIQPTRTPSRRRITTAKTSTVPTMKGTNSRTAAA